MTDFSPNKPKTQMKTKADIGICIDQTGSMSPCIDGVKTSVNTFADGLQTSAKVDYRLRLIAYGDLPAMNEPVEENNFCEPGDHLSFQRQVEALYAHGGGPEPESTLDALYVAINSEWRHPCHKAILVFTDAPCYPEMHASTIKRFGLSDGSIHRIIDALTANRIQLFLAAPDFEVYRTIEAQTPGSRYEVAGEGGSGLASFNFKEVMDAFSRSISVSSKAWFDEDEGEEELL